jgi:alanine racemase
VHRFEEPLVLRPTPTSPADCLRPTRAEIDLDAIASNLEVLRAHLGGAKVLAVVKADAYGHGVVPVARRLQANGVDGFGVALAEEGFELREAGIHVPIVVLNGIHGGAHRAIIEKQLTPVVYELDEARGFDAAADGPVDVHLKVDTGMSRLGVPLRELGAFLEALGRLPHVRISGVMTHLSEAEGDEAVTRRQLDRFEEALAAVRAAGHRPEHQHVSNSAGAIRFPQARRDWVRLGIALYGHAPTPGLATSLRVSMRLRTEIISMRTIEAGERVGYSGTFTATAPTRVATLAIGYGDGLSRGLSNRGHVLVRGVRCPVVGNVSMDLTGVDVTGVPEARIGDEAVFLGAQGSEEITIGEFADAAGILPYEVLTNVSRRVPRFYLTRG